jgi:hypothetical protein
MFTTKCVALAFIGTAAAFNPMMSVSTGRRAAIQGAAGAAIVAPLLRPTEAEAAVAGQKSKYPGNMVGNPSAPVITVMDHRGCKRTNTEYKGVKALDENDEQCIVLKMQKVGPGEAGAVKFLGNVLGQLKDGPV